MKRIRWLLAFAWRPRCRICHKRIKPKDLDFNDARQLPEWRQPMHFMECWPEDLRVALREMHDELIDETKARLEPDMPRIYEEITGESYPDKPLAVPQPDDDGPHETGTDSERSADA